MLTFYMHTYNNPTKQSIACKTDNQVNHCVQIDLGNRDIESELAPQCTLKQHLQRHYKNVKCLLKCPLNVPEYDLKSFFITTSSAPRNALITSRLTVT